MIPKECKRLAEVDSPIAAVSAHSAREKSIRHGHPSTLHMWRAQRPAGVAPRAGQRGICCSRSAGAGLADYGPQAGGVADKLDLRAGGTGDLNALPVELK